MSTARRGRLVAAALLAGYSALLALALLWPTSDRQSGMVSWLVEALQHLGLSSSLVTFTRAEVLMNVLIIAPVTFLGSLWRPRMSWRSWTAYGFVASLTVELVQGLLLPDRQAAFSDVVANTTGALLGAVVVAGWRARSRRTQRPLVGQGP